MRQIVYALRFRGEARWFGTDGNLLRTVARASGCSIRSLFDGGGLQADVRDELGDEIHLESELTITGATTYQEAGSVVFGQTGDRLRFSTCGSGYLDPVSEDTARHGAAVLCIDEGDRRFAGAHGLITSHYAVDDAGVITVFHLGSIYVQDGVTL